MIFKSFCVKNGFIRSFGKIQKATKKSYEICGKENVDLLMTRRALHILHLTIK